MNPIMMCDNSSMNNSKSYIWSLSRMVDRSIRLSTPDDVCKEPTDCPMYASVNPVISRTFALACSANWNNGCGICGGFCHVIARSTSMSETHVCPGVDPYFRSEE